MSNKFTKDPQAVLDYQVDWTEWLGADTIINSSWTIPDGITKVSDTYNDKTTTVVLSSGTVKEVYSCTNHIVTAVGREDDRTIKIVIKEK